ncbi:MAG: zinc-ribbon domain-containing protein, partial [Polyangia bacterium]
MKCVKCGNALEAGARFCGACGTQQPGAVIPQASVRTGAKTLFQGSAGVPAVKAPEPSKPAAATAVPEKKGPVSSAMSFAATMAPGSVEMKAIAPPTAVPPAAKPTPTPAKPAATTPVSKLPPPAADGDLTGKLLNNRYLIEDKLGEGGFGA